MTVVPESRFAWCFSHGRRHAFNPAAPWCTATWVWLWGDRPESAESEKVRRFGDAVFLEDLPDLMARMAVMMQSEVDQLRCGWCLGDGGDPQDEGDWISEVGMHDPGTRAACPVCYGTGKVS